MSRYAPQHRQARPEPSSSAMSAKAAVVTDSGTGPTGSVTGPRMHKSAVSMAVSVIWRVDMGCGSFR